MRATTTATNTLALALAVCAGVGFVLLLPATAQAEELNTATTSAEQQQQDSPTLKLPRCADQESDTDFRTSTGCSGVFGLRGNVTSMQRGPGEPGAGLTIGAEGEEFLRRKTFSMHGMHRLGIGGGSAGFEGTLLGAMAVGFRVPVAERHGPVIRAGVHGYIRGNDAFYGSLLELPQLQLGYQYMRGTTVFELGGTTGVILAGRERAGDATRRILGEGFEIGGYAAAQGPWFRIGLRAMQLPTSDLLTSNVRMAEGTICGMVSPMAVCADARVSQMSAFTAPNGFAQDVMGLHAGLSIGFTRER